VYDARLQKAEREFEVLTSDGLQLKVNLAWRFRVIPSVLPALHQHVGPEYQNVMITPSVGARARDVIAVYRPEDIYTDHRLEIQDQISESVRYELNNFFAPMSKDIRQWIVLEDVLVRRIELPHDVEESIIRKNIARHEVERYSLIVEKELRETERKRIEALGIRNFQEIVSQGMSDSYLRWRGIEATLELARSNNAKVVVVGNNGTGGLPLISISGDDTKKEEPRKQAKKESGGKVAPSETDPAIAGKPDNSKQGSSSDGVAKPDGKPVKEDENAREARLQGDKVPQMEVPGLR
jgi:regulator of protease activity HflC (stomatin/prohibitin superfamily)